EADRLQATGQDIIPSHRAPLSMGGRTHRGGPDRDRHGGEVRSRATNNQSTAVGMMRIPPPTAERTRILPRAIPRRTRARTPAGWPLPGGSATSSLRIPASWPGPSLPPERMTGQPSPHGGDHVLTALSGHVGSMDRRPHYTLNEPRTSR